MSNERVKTTQIYKTSDGMYHETMDAANAHADRSDWNQWWDAHYMKSEGHNVTPGATFNFLKDYMGCLPWELFGVNPVKTSTPGSIVYVPDDPSTRETALSNRVKHLEGVLRQIQTRAGDMGAADIASKCRDALYAHADALHGAAFRTALYAQSDDK